MRSLRLQLLISHLSLVLLLALVMSGAITRFFGLTRAIDRILQKNLTGERTAQNMRDAVEDHQKALVFFLIGHPEVATSLLRESEQTFRSELRQNEASASDPSTAATAAQVESQYQIYRGRVDSLIAAYHSQGRRSAEVTYLKQVEPAQLDLIHSIQSLIALNQQAIISANESAHKEAIGAFYQSLVITVAALALAIFLAMRMVRMALTPLTLLAKQAEVIGGGDLTRQIDLKRSDEIGALADSFNSMATKLADARKSEVRRLQRAERMSDAALESLYDPVIVTDARARIVHLNSAASGIFGEVPSSPRIAVEDHVQDRRIVRAIQRAVHQEAVSAGEDETALVQITLNGAIRTYRLRANPMFTEDGLVLGSVAVLEDVTHLKELDRLKNEFIGVASHELRTPVTSLLLSVQLLEEGAAGTLNPAQRELVAVQRQDLERLERLMRELLDITRLEAGTTVPRLASLPAAELLVAALQATQGLAEKAQIKLSIDPNPAYVLVRADRGQILRVLINLIDNGIRHTNAGGSVTLRAEAREDDVLFSVEDTGDGIPEEYLAKIFDRFVQVPGATQGGAGLGLSIARTIAQAHGGTMSVSSKPHVGSKFTFNLMRSMNQAGDQ